jgi:DNA mismatch repair protein MutL
VHPAKTEVRFRQSGVIHDFVRDSLRMALVKARPVAAFAASLDAPNASPSLMPPAESRIPGLPEPDSEPVGAAEAEPFQLMEFLPPQMPGALPFAAAPLSPADGLAEIAGALVANITDSNGYAAATVEVEARQAAETLNHLAGLKPLGQLKESFILATGPEGLWIIDQHVAHERVLYEKILRERAVENVQRQRLLMPLLVELKPAQMVVFAEIAAELERNGFEAEPFGPQTLAVKAAPVGLEGAQLERMLQQVIEQTSGASGAGVDTEVHENAQNHSLSALKTRIAASIACHAAIKVNTPLDPAIIEWLLLELARTEHPTSCPHGRPIALLYSWREIQRAFHRI